MNIKWVILAAALLCGFQSIAADKPDTTWVYKQIGSKELKMDVFLPDGYESASKPFPAMVK